MLPVDDASSLSLLYHLNSEPWLNFDAYQQAATYEVEYKNVATVGAPIPLASPAQDQGLMALLKKRSSCRDYAQRPLAAELLGQLMYGAYGVARIDHELFDGEGIPLRTVPSAGGLFPLELYVLTQRVEGVPDGLHHYNVRDHILEPLNLSITLKQLEPVLLMYPCIANANLIVFITAVFERSQRKYGPRGYRYVLLEAGHVAQNLCLLSAERELGSLCMGGYVDCGLNRALELREAFEGVVYCVSVGHAIER